MNEDTGQAKFVVKAEICATIDRICTGDAYTCRFGYCQINLTCAKPYYTPEILQEKPLEKLRLVLSHAKDKVHPDQPKGRQTEKRKYSCRERSACLWMAYEILGESILQHPLIKGKPDVIKEIKMCGKLTQLVKILEREHNKINEKPISLPGKGKMHYRKFLHE